MISPTPSPQADDFAFDELWRAIQAGHSTEYRQLVGECTPYLLRVIRKRLDRRLRGRFDSMDFTQAVWLSFVAQLDALPVFSTVDELRAYLAQMASFKVIDEVRRQGEQGKRDISREFPLRSDEAVPTPALHPTASQFAMANEQLEQLKAGRTPTHQQIIQLKFEGESVPGIAQAVGLSERQVRRVLLALEEDLHAQQSHGNA